MLIKIWKQRTIQIEAFSPVSFGYGLEQEVKDSVHTHKEGMETMVDGWLEEETKKWKNYQKKSSGNAVAPIKERSPF